MRFRDLITKRVARSTIDDGPSRIVDLQIMYSANNNSYYQACSNNLSGCKGLQYLLQYHASFSNTRQSKIMTIDKCSLQQKTIFISSSLSITCSKSIVTIQENIITSLQRTQLRIKIPTYLWQYLPASLFLRLVHKLML